MSEWDDFRSSKTVRVVHAAVDETVEIHWRRRMFPHGIDQTLVERYTAPPSEVWTARQKERDDRAAYESDRSSGPDTGSTS